MSNLKSFTGYHDTCSICGATLEPLNAWTYERENDNDFLICNDCAKFLVNTLSSHYPDQIDKDLLKENMGESNGGEEHE